MLGFQFIVSFLLVYLSRGLCDECNDVDGFWYSQDGSEIFLEHSSDGKLIGEYRSAADRFEQHEGRKQSIISGVAPYNSPGATFSFAVSWSNGSSTQVWTCQCLVCKDGKEVILTSWLKMSGIKTCDDTSQTTVIGQDSFTRSEQTLEVSTMDNRTPYVPSFDASNLGLTQTKIKSGQPCDLTGTWYNQLGSEMILQQGANGIIVGEYRTAVERKKGSAGESHSDVYGVSTPGTPYSTFALTVVWRGGASVTGWVGQCHICGENNTEVIDTSWLLRIRLDQCLDNWKSTTYGKDSFTREEQKEGPRKHLRTHTPDRGEDDADHSGERNWISEASSGTL